MSETATPGKFTVQGDGVVSHRPSEMRLLFKKDVEFVAIGAAHVGDSWWLVVETLGR